MRALPSTCGPEQLLHKQQQQRAAMRTGVHASPCSPWPRAFAVAAGTPLSRGGQAPRLGGLMKSRWRKSQLLSSSHSLLCRARQQLSGPCLSPSSPGPGPFPGSANAPTLPLPPPCHCREECGPDVILYEAGPADSFRHLAAVIAASSLPLVPCPAHSLVSLPGSLLNSLLNLSAFACKLSLFEMKKMLRCKEARRAS